MRLAGASALVLLAFTATEAGGQGVALQLRPHAGDTLRLRMDQTIESSRTIGPKHEPSPADAASLVILARIAVDGVDVDGANVTAHTDSVRVSSTEGFAASPTLMAARAMQGRRFRFRMLPDGGSMIAGDDVMAQGLAPLFNQLPATLPKNKVEPGATWVRSVEIPIAAAPEGRATLDATFRFDSLSSTGEYAHLSIRGRLIRSGQVAGAAKGTLVQTSGDVTGKILLDLRRGWIADARSMVTLTSLVTHAGKPASTRVRVKITQWMRVL